MDQKHKELLIWGVVVTVALIILYLLLRKKDNSVNNGQLPVFATPRDYLYNFGPRNINMSIDGLPTIDSGGPSSSGCSQASTQLVNGIQSLLDYFASSAKTAFDQYENTVTSNVPSLVSQFFNNPTIAQSRESYGILGAY